MTSVNYIPALTRVSRDLAPLERCYQMLERAAEKGFEWPDCGYVLKKVNEEWHETEAAMAAGDPNALGEEIGDTLSAVVNLARHQGIALPAHVLQAGDVMPLSDEAHVIAAMKTEIKAADNALMHPDRDALTGAVRGMLLALSDLARMNGLQADDCLKATNTKFENRFTAVERAVRLQGKPMETVPLAQLIGIWNAQKNAPENSFRCL